MGIMLSLTRIWKMLNIRPSEKHSLCVYIASHFNVLARELADYLSTIKSSVRIVSTWFDETFKKDDVLIPKKAGIRIKKNYDELKKADVLILIEDRTGFAKKGGRFVEAGYFLCLRRPVICFGSDKPDNLMLEYHPLVKSAPDYASLRKELLRFQAVKYHGKKGKRL